jgi:hypothetical protein
MYGNDFEINYNTPLYKINNNKKKKKYIIHYIFYINI